MLGGDRGLEKRGFEEFMKLVSFCYCLYNSVSCKLANHVNIVAASNVILTVFLCG